MTANEKVIAEQIRRRKASRNRYYKALRRRNTVPKVPPAGPVRRWISAELVSA